jgi:hypothetical protein
MANTASAKPADFDLVYGECPTCAAAGRVSRVGLVVDLGIVCEGEDVHIFDTNPVETGDETGANLSQVSRKKWIPAAGSLDDVCPAPAGEQAAAVPAASSVPDLPTKPAATAGEKPAAVSLHPWETSPGLGGDVLMLVALPEGYAQALQAEAENQNRTLGEQVADLIGRMAENGWL